MGIELSDYDAVNVPMVRVDPYGKFIPGANGFAQLIVDVGADGIAQTADDVLVEGNPAAPVSPLAVGALRTGHPFLADIAHSANPFSSQTGAPLAVDADLSPASTMVLPAPTTTSCWPSTSSPATDASTRTSA